jgi:hypothetical protein
MKVTAIKARTFFPAHTGLSAYHSSLFHGYAKRRGMDTENLQDTNWSPLEYIYNLASKARIAQPKSNLVIMKKLCPDLGLPKNVKLIPVIIKKYVNVPFAKGDMSYFENESPKTGGDYPRILRASREIREQQGVELSFEELCAPVIAEGIADGSECKVRFGDSETKVLRLSGTWLSEHKCGWLDSCHIFVSTLVEKILPHVNRDFFELCEFEID